jgi:hypothetical protein
LRRLMEVWSFMAYGLIFFLKSKIQDPIRPTTVGRGEQFLTWDDYMIEQQEKIISPVISQSCNLKVCIMSFNGVDPNYWRTDAHLYHRAHEGFHDWKLGCPQTREREQKSNEIDI